MFDHVRIDTGFEEVAAELADAMSAQDGFANSIAVGQENEPSPTAGQVNQSGSSSTRSIS